MVKFLRDMVAIPSESCEERDVVLRIKEEMEKVGFNFDCSDCVSLESLKGASKEVGGDFYCTNCPALKSLEGISPNVKGEIYSDIK